MPPMKQVTVYIGTKTSKRGKTKVVSVHYDLGYVWDQIFEFVAEESPRVWVIPENATRKEARAIARERGYKVHKAIARIDTY